MALTFVEDYLEFLFGTMDREGNPAQQRYLYTAPQAVIKLATYDKSPVASMGTFCSKARSEGLDTCLTDRQVDLARKIIVKYRRQLLALGIILPEEEKSIPLRHNVRIVDRSQHLEYSADEKRIRLRFPYSPKKISTLHEYSNQSAGLCEWNNADRKWEMDLTEGNLRKVLSLFDGEDLKIDNDLEPHVIAIMQSGPKDLPTLTIENGVMNLANCHSNIHEHMAKLGWDPLDVASLAKWSAYVVTLGVRLDQTILDVLHSLYGSDVVSVITERKVNMATKNLPMGPWYDSLLEVNSVLSDYPWILHLSWWTKETDWKPFKNIHNLSSSEQNNRQSQFKFAERLTEFKTPIVVLDSIIGNESLRNFVEQNAVKVIYINDIGLS